MAAASGKSDGEVSASPSGPGTDGDDPTAVSEEELFDVLSNRRRRYAVHALDSDRGAVELGSLAEQVAAWEYGVGVDELSHAQRKRVYTSLQQSHLPKMDAAGIVEFDKRRGLVEPTPAFEDVEIYMEVVRGRDVPWSEYYLGLATVGGAVLLAAAVDAWPLALLPDLAWGVFLVVALAVSASFHRYYVRELGATDEPPDTDR